MRRRENFPCYLRSETSAGVFILLPNAVSSRTIATKSRHPARLAVHAVTFFTGKDEKRRGKGSAVLEFLRSAAASCKTASRMDARRRKNLYDCLERMAILLPQDFTRFGKAAKRKLQSIMRTARELQRDMDMPFMHRVLVQRKDCSKNGA